MSIARPDTSRRREPQCPGRRFGTSATHTTATSSRALFGALVATALLAGPAAQVHADEDGPIVLSNADVERLHAKEAKASDKTGAQPAAATQPKAEADPQPSEADLAAMRAMEADLKRRLDRISQQSMGNVTRTLDARALGEAPATMPPISAGPDVDTTQAVPAAPAPGGAVGEEEDDEPQASLKRAIEPESACMYGPRGRLLHEPTGRECAAIRVSAPSQQFDTDRELEARTSTKRKSQVGCVYGSRGQLLYSSPGLECAG